MAVGPSSRRPAWPSPSDLGRAGYCRRGSFCLTPRAGTLRMDRALVSDASSSSLPLRHVALMPPPPFIVSLRPALAWSPPASLVGPVSACPLVPPSYALVSFLPPAPGSARAKPCGPDCIGILVLGAHPRAPNGGRSSRWAAGVRRFIRARAEYNCCRCTWSCSHSSGLSYRSAAESSLVRRLILDRPAAYDRFRLFVVSERAVGQSRYERGDFSDGARAPKSLVTLRLALLYLRPEYDRLVARRRARGTEAQESSVAAVGIEVYPGRAELGSAARVPAAFPRLLLRAGRNRVLRDPEMPS